MEMGRSQNTNKTPLISLDLDISREKKEGQTIGDMETYNAGRTK